MNRELERKWILSESAWSAIKQNMPIGTIIEGYEPEKKVTITTGEEGSVGKYDGFCERQTLETNNDLIWRYGGIDEHGNVVIVSDIPKNSHSKSKIMLANSGGYVRGPMVLNKVCEDLYSIENLGRARNMNISDVNRILDYTGPRGKYWDLDGRGIETEIPIAIGELDGKFRSNIAKTKTPDGFNIETYKSNYYCILDGTRYITEEKMLRDMVYPKVDQEYWLSSTCINACFGYNVIGFSVRYVKGNCVNAHYMVMSDGDVYGYKSYIRPVIILLPKVKLEYSKERGVCKIY